MKIACNPQFALGYFRHASHELEPVRHCPISSPLINRAIAALWELAPEVEKHPGLREVQFFSNHDDSALLVELLIDPAAAATELKELGRALRERMPEVAGVAVFYAGSREADDDDSGSISNSPRTVRAELIEGAEQLTYRVGEFAYRVSAGSFFQTNRFLASKLVELVTRDRSGRSALDLYAGVGLFTRPLARSFERVTAVEIAPRSCQDLAANTAVPHIRTEQSTTEEFLKRARGRWDFAVVDPPRAGLGERAAKALGALGAPQITYVSCDPATLARDLVPLTAAGYRVEEAHLVDLFPQTYHLETILHLAR